MAASLLASIPDPANLWRPNRYHNPKYMMNLNNQPRDYQAMVDKFKLARQHPEWKQYPMMAEAGDVPIHLVGTPQPAQAYQPVPARTPNNEPSSTAITHFAEGPVYTAQGEVRDTVVHPFQNLGYTLVHHPADFFKRMWELTQDTVRWVVFQYTDFYHQLTNWHGGIDSFSQSMGLVWRGAIVAALTLGFVEIAPLMNALATWIRLVFDLLRGALGLVGEAVDELWNLLTRLWDDITGLVF